MQSTYNQQLENQKTEFDKLLVENTALISEIDSVSDKLESNEAELALIKSELQEINSSSEGRVVDLKETLNSKNYELTNLAANNSALQTELELLKAELESAKAEVKLAQESNELYLKLQDELNVVAANKSDIEGQVSGYQSTIGLLNTELFDLKNTIQSYQNEISNLKSESKTDEQEAFIDRLFKQIDILNDEKLGLLSEKEAMAVELLKMNNTVSEISQHIDSHSIDITELDNHRKNVILAGGSSNVSSEKTIMKKQISELVREIDKCIALLSA